MGRDDVGPRGAVAPCTRKSVTSVAGGLTVIYY
jgi:hypothetical protein